MSRVSFKIGDNAVYPSHGVGRISDIESRNINGQKQEFYILQMHETGMKVMVPINKVESIGLRQIITKNAVSKVFTILKGRPNRIDHQTWNRRYRFYMEKIRTGSPYEIAAVLRDLYKLKGAKDLSFGERKMLDTAKNFLVKEISLARKIDEGEVEKQITNIFGSC